MYISRFELLQKCNIAEMVEKGLTLNAITNEVKIKASNENITLYNEFIEKFIKSNLNYIRNPNYKKDNDESYWIKNNNTDNSKEDNQLDFFDKCCTNTKNTSPSLSHNEEDSNLSSESNKIKDFDKINETTDNKSLAKDFNHLNITPKNTSENKSENHSVEDSFSTSNSKDENSKLNELDNAIKTLFKNVNEIKSQLKSFKKANNSSPSNPPITKAYLDEIIKIFDISTETQTITLNSKILENIKEILNEQYNVTGDISKIVNLGLLIAILKRDE